VFYINMLTRKTRGYIPLRMEYGLFLYKFKSLFNFKWIYLYKSIAF